jgi:hypothetical protein
MTTYNPTVSQGIPAAPTAEASGTDSRIPEAPSARRRPVPVTILAGLQLLAALGYALTCLALLQDGKAALAALTGMPGLAVGERGPLAVALAVVILGGAGVAALWGAILLLRMRRLGWTITMLLAGLGLATSIWVWWSTGAGLTAWLVIQVATVFYLNQRQTRQAFGLSGRTAVDAMQQGRG